MGKVKAKTLQERFGFSDEELSTPKHDEIVMLCADKAQEIVDLFLKNNELVSSVVWEPVIKNKRGFEIGFIDLVIHTYEKGKDIDGHDRRFQGPSLYIEAKTRIDSLGVLFRQLGMYKDNLFRYSEDEIVVACPDNRFANTIRGQGYLFLEVSV